MTDADATRQRIDKWLWCARFFKTRSLASKFVASSGLRVNRSGTVQRINKCAAHIRVADELSFVIGGRLFVIQVEALAERRGPASEARELYTDKSPEHRLPGEPRTQRSTGQPAAPAFREKGSGRPTKKDRRAIDALHE